VFSGRIAGRGVEPVSMLRDQADQPAEQDRTPGSEFERHLFRLSVDLLREERARCCDCGRTPLVGEDVHTYDRGKIVCELCRQLRPTAPISSQRVHHSELGHTVRLRRAA
jgi:hypothetical protein